jgi:hypothetical protein
LTVMTKTMATAMPPALGWNRHPPSSERNREYGQEDESPQFHGEPRNATPGRNHHVGTRREQRHD